MADLLNMILHVDQFMGVWIAQHGDWIYLVLFLIVFCETGLVVLPFLPGDSLLFIAGALGATGALDPLLLAALLIVAAVLGNTVNYSIGRMIGPRVFTSKIRFLDQKALLRTHVFYEKHGGKTLVLSRFLPIFRTFAPFVAGVAFMRFIRFQAYNIVGAVLWVAGLVALGYFFGNVPFIKAHLNTIAIVGVSAAIVPLLAGGIWKLLRRGMKS